MIKRTFLEPAKSGIDSYVTTSIDGDQRSLKIHDCDRGISLDFSSGKYDSRTLTGARRKLVRLQDALDEIRASLDD